MSDFLGPKPLTATAAAAQATSGTGTFGTALSATILDKVSDDVADPAGIVPTALGSEIERAGSPALVALAKRDVHNILDFGVVRGTTASQTVAIKAALDSKPGASFYFPPGDYRLDTGLVIGKSNSLVLSEGTRIYAGAAMTTLITFFKDTSGYAEDKSITGHGWLLDGNLLAQRILSLGKVIRFSLIGGNFKDGINRGIVTEAGLGAELIASDLRLYNTTATNVTDNIAIEAKMGDSHFRDIVIRDWTTAVKDTSFNRWNRVHPWISQDTGPNPNMTNRYPTSIAFDLTGNSDVTECVSDTYRTAFKLRTNGTGYTAPARFLNSRAMWAVDPMLTTAMAAANPATVFDNTDGVGAWSDRLTVTGHSLANTASLFTGSSVNMNIRNNGLVGYMKGGQGTTTEPFEYLGGIQQGVTTFTPTLIGSNGAGTHTYNSRSGRMVVDGDEVTYYVRINALTDATSAFQGVIRIGGLPYPFGSTNLRDGAGTVGLATNVPASTAVVYNTATPTAPYIALMSMGATGTTEIDIAGQSLRAKTVDLMVRISTTHFKQ